MSGCNPPSITLPSPPAGNVLQLIIEALAALGITIPALPTVPLPAPPCPLDDL